MAKEAILKNEDGTILYPRTISDVVLDAETGYPIGEVYTKNIKADENGRLLVTNGDKRYFVGLTELKKPNQPHIAETTYSVVTGSASITVENKTSGADMYYRTSEDDEWVFISSNTTGTIYYPTGYNDTTDNKPITDLIIYLKAIKDREESDVKEVSIIINPKVASGSVSVKLNNNENDWSTQATITLSASPTKDAQSKYSEDKGVSWEDLLDSKTITVSTEENNPMEILAGTYQVQATKGGYVDAKTEKNSLIKIGARKAYYGFSSNDSLGELSDITSLKTTGGVREEYKLKTKTSYQIYPSKSGSTDDGYIWLCCQESLTPDKIFSDANNPIPFGFNNAAEISGYKCYRSENLLIGNENYTIYIKD